MRIRSPFAIEGEQRFFHCGVWSRLHVRHERPIGHPLLELPNYCGFGLWDRDCPRCPSAVHALRQHHDPGSPWPILRSLFVIDLISDGNHLFEAHPMARSAARLRRRSVRCPVCKKRFKVNPRGRPPTFCSRSCRQRAYEQRRWSRPHPIELLARGIDTARVRDVIRQEVREALLAAGIILPPPAPKPKRRGPPLRLIDK
jgi:hypothetical protein